jgi:hypothetical protein
MGFITYSVYYYLIESYTEPANLLAISWPIFAEVYTAVRLVLLKYILGLLNHHIRLGPYSILCSSVSAALPNENQI